MTLWRLSWRECRYWLTYYRRMWRGTSISILLNPVLFLTSLGVGLGTLVNRNGNAPLHGTSYLVFVAPALLAVTAMQTAASGATYHVLGSAKWMRNYHAAVATPLDATSVFLGHLMCMALRILAASTVYLLVLAAFGAARSALVLLALPAALLTGLAFAAPIAGWSITRETDAPFAALQRFGITPMFLFSGTFFPVAQLPVVLRVAAYATPLWHGVDLCRSLALGTATWGMTTIHLAYLIALTALGIGAARVTYRHRLNP
jgi:lipooligosaccharide transport system permease protein